MATYTVYVDQSAGSNSNTWAQAQSGSTPWLTLQKAIEGDPSGGVLAAGDTYIVKMMDYATRRDYASGKCIMRMGYATYPASVNIIVEAADGASKWQMDGEYYLCAVDVWSGAITIRDCDFLGRTNTSAIDFTGNAASVIRVEDSTIAWATNTWGTGAPAYMEASKTLTGSLTFSNCIITAGRLARHQSTIPTFAFTGCTITLGVAASGAAGWFSSSINSFKNFSLTACTVSYVAATAGFPILGRSDVTFGANSVWDFTGSTITATCATSVTDTGHFMLFDASGGVTSGQVTITFSGTTITANTANTLVSIGPASEAAAKTGQSPGGIQSPTFVNSVFRNLGTGGTLCLGYGLNSTVLHDCQFHCGSLGHGVQITSNGLNVYNLFVTGNLGILNWGDNNHIHDCVVVNTAGAAAGSLLIGRPGATNADDPAPLWLPTAGGEMDHNIVIIGPGSSCTNAFYAKNENVMDGETIVTPCTVYMHDNSYLIGNTAGVLGYLGGEDRTTLAALQAEWQTLGVSTGEAGSVLNRAITVPSTRRR